MKTKLPIEILFTFTFFLFTCAALAEIRFVSTTGSSVPPYTTWATASDSIQKAINICNNGDTVIVANGTFKEALLINKRIALIGMSKDSTIIDGRGMIGLVDTSTTIYLKADCKIENFHLIGKNINEYLLWAMNFLVKVENCLVENARHTFILYGRSSEIKNVIAKNFDRQFVFWTSVNDTNNPVIENCLAYKNRNSSPIIVLEYGGNPIIRSNIFSFDVNSNYGTAIDQWGWINRVTIENNLFYGCNSYSAVTTLVVDSIKIINNTSKKKRKVGNAFWLTYGEKAIIRNNIMTDNEEALYTYYNQANSNYNLYWNNLRNTGGHGTMGQNDIIADPMFVKDTIPIVGSGDFHLQKYSPGIDAGDPSILDIDDSRSDIGFYGGPYGEEYKYLDLAPQPPKGLSGIIDSGLIKLNWGKNTENDFNYYKLFRDTVSSFTADSTSFVLILSDTFYNETYPVKAGKYFYKLTAVDSQRNESLPSDEIGVSLTSLNHNEPLIIQDYKLYQCYPNPFNSSTVIPFRLKEPGYVKINIYDIKGEMVGSVFNGDKNSGYHEVNFIPGINTTGSSKDLASGIYLYSIDVIGKNSIPAFSDIKKMVYLK